MSIQLVKSDALSVRWSIDLRAGQLVEIIVPVNGFQQTVATMRFDEFEKWISEVDRAMALLRMGKWTSLLDPES